MPRLFIALGAILLMALAGLALWLDRPVPGDTSSGAPAEVSAGAIYASRFPGLDGREQMLGQWQGKLLVLNFWATWCAPCREEMPMLSRVQTEFSGRDLQIVGIAADSRENVANFVQKVPIAYPLLPDEARAIEFSKRLGNRLGLLPFTVVVSPRGDIVFTRLGQVSEADLRDLAVKYAK